MNEKVTFEQIRKANETIVPRMLEHRDKRTGEIVQTPYPEVNQRIKAFRQVYPDGFIVTEIEKLEGGAVIFRAQVGYYESSGLRYVLGEGTAREGQQDSYINKTSYIENAETSAVGRALGMAGFGIDYGVASAEEVEGAKAAQAEQETPAEATRANVTPENPQPAPGRDLSAFSTLKQRLVAATGQSEEQAGQVMLAVLGDPRQMNDEQYAIALKNGETYVKTAEANRRNINGA